VTIDDSKTLRAMEHAVMRFTLLPDTDLFEFVCEKKIYDPQHMGQMKYLLSFVLAAAPFWPSLLRAEFDSKKPVESGHTAGSDGLIPIAVDSHGRKTRPARLRSGIASR